MLRDLAIPKSTSEGHYILLNGKLIWHPPIRQSAQFRRIIVSLSICMIFIGVVVYELTKSNEVTLFDLQRFGAASDCHADSLYANGENSWELDDLDAISRDCAMVAGVSGIAVIDESTSP